MLKMQSPAHIPNIQALKHLGGETQESASLTPQNDSLVFSL